MIPNPNNGQMTLRFENIVGKVNVKVYDMRGGLLDDFQTYNESGSCTMPYDLKACSNGVYFFVVVGEEGTMTKKVVISNR